MPFFITLLVVVGSFDFFWPYTWWFLQVMSARHTHICRCSPHRSWIVTDINRKCTDSFDYNLSPHVFLLLYGKESPSSQCFCYLYSRIVLLLRAKHYYHIYIMALPPALASSHHWPQIIIYPSIWTNINELLLLSYHSPVSLCCNCVKIPTTSQNMQRMGRIG